MIKTASILTLALLIAAPAAHAESLAVSVNAQADIHANANASGQMKDKAATTSTSTPDVDEQDHGTSTEKQDNASTTANAHGQATAEAHRSEVATFVHSLLAIADRDGGIGAQVRQVAQSQSDSASTTASAMTKIETRSKLADFLVGTDWKSVGALRSEIARTDSDIARLKALLDQASSADVRTSLQVQIDALQKSETEMQAFVNAHANSFSLFGWFTKLFATTSNS